MGTKVLVLLIGLLVRWVSLVRTVAEGGYCQVVKHQGLYSIGIFRITRSGG